MSEEPKAPILPESNGEDTPGFPPRNRTSREDSTFPSLEELRRITGNLDLPREDTSNLPIEEMRRETGDLDSSREEPSIPSFEEIRREIGDLDSSREAPSMPSLEEIRRETGDLDTSREKTSTTAPELPIQPNPAASRTQDSGEIRDTQSLMRRLTGSIRRRTGPLDRSEKIQTPPEDLPAHDVEDAFDQRLSSLGRAPEAKAEPQPPERKVPPIQPKPEDPVREKRDTNSLLHRITGTLKRVTGPLGKTSPPSPPREERRTAEEKSLAGVTRGAVSPESDEPAEKRRRDTGSLGSILSGILRGQPGEEGSPQKKQDQDDYVSEIRQNLASEEVIRPKRPRKTGLLGLITGNLRRMTGSLSPMPPARPQEDYRPLRPEPSRDLSPTPEPARSEVEAEIIEEVLLEDRLAGTAVSEPTAWAEPEDFVIELGPPEIEIAEELPMEIPAPPEADALRGDEPISLLDSGAIAALGESEEARQVEAEPDWMAEIRQEAAEEEVEKGPADAADKPKGITSPLRDFIAGIFRSEEKQPTPPESEFTDDLVTGRLGLDVGAKPAAEEEIIPGELDVPDWERATRPLSSGYPTPTVEPDFSLDDDLSFVDRLARFDQTAPEETVASGSVSQEAEDQGEVPESFVPYEPLQTRDTGEVFTISAEDEKLLWGAPSEEEVEEPKTFRADDYWDPLRMSLAEDWEPKKPLDADDAYAAAFLTGTDLEPDTGRLKSRRRVTGKLNRETEKKPFEDIRSVLLGDYQAAEQQRQGKTGESAAAISAPGVMEEDEELAAPKPRGLKEWLGTRTTMQKIILVELVLVVLALFTAVPYFFYLILGGSQSPAARQNEFPANLPYPTGLTLPGGWQFTLSKSTMENDRWQPKQSEWLSGTEVRRVVALPWNRQTEAVARSFQAGDVISLELSNADTIKYKVERVVQVDVEDTSIFSDVTPSLVIILYPQKNDKQPRWVVFCNR